jgi:hypothetical protein
MARAKKPPGEKRQPSRLPFSLMGARFMARRRVSAQSVRIAHARSIVPGRENVQKSPTAKFTNDRSQIYILR